MTVASVSPANSELRNPDPTDGSLQPRSKAIVIVAAVAQNSVIGIDNTMPWHLPEDFRHFRRVTNGQTLVMGRTTFDSIGRPLPGRETVVLTRDRSWRREGVRVVHSPQEAIDAAEDLPGNVMVVGGSHVYATFLAVAQVQIISEVRYDVLGDAYYPPWDRAEWMAEGREHHQDFDVARYHRIPQALRPYAFNLSARAAADWWRPDSSERLRLAVERQRRNSQRERGLVDWNRVHAAVMRVIIEAAEYHRRAPAETVVSKQVRLSQHLSVEDVKAVQGALLHWSEFLAPR